MRVAATIELSEQEGKELRRLSSSRSISVGFHQRVRIVLLSSEGKTNQQIAAELGVSQPTVSQWRNRFASERLEGIRKERPRGGNHGGKNAKDQEKLRQQIIAATTQTKPLDATHWSCRSMAKAMGTTHSFVNRVWLANGLKPHLIKTFKLSNDPHFEHQLVDVVGLYLHPPDNAVVFSFDEKSAIQALDRTQPGLPFKKGRCGTMTHDYKRHGTTSLFAALNIASGEVIGQVYRRHRHQEVLKFFKAVEKTVDKGLEIHIILDNYSTHKHPDVLQWIENKKRIYLHFIPTSSSWLNLVERFFSTLTEKQIRRGVFTSVAHLEECLKNYLDTYNESPRPLIWTKSAKQITDKVARGRSALAEGK